MLAVFACTVYGKNVFSKESKWLRTVNVCLSLLQNQQNLNSFLLFQGSSPWWPSREPFVLVDL